jgi:hypothetical protein
VTSVILYESRKLANLFRVAGLDAPVHFGKRRESDDLERVSAR